MTVMDQLIVILLCFVGSAFMSGIETGVVSIDPMQLQHLVRRKDKAARILRKFLEDSDRLLGTTLVGNNIVNVTISVLTADLFVRWIPGYWAEISSTLAVTLLVVVFGEFLPKAWFYSRPLERCRMFAGTLQVVAWVLRPLAVAVVWITKALVPGKGKKSFAKAGIPATREDLRMLVKDGEKGGALSAVKRAMIHNVLTLSDKSARQVMVPREKMVLAYTDTPIPAFLDIARAARFTRIPVFDRERNEFAGIVNVFFVVASEPQGEGKTIAGFVRRPLFVTATMPVHEILPLMRRSRQPMCLVVDDKHEVIGLVTTEDIAREIVGKS